MITPFRQQHRQDSMPTENPPDFVLTLQTPAKSIVIDNDGFTIGASPKCDLTIPDSGVPPLHSRIHLQSGAMWIQAADDDTLLLVNGQSCHGMTLRDDDQLKIGTVNSRFGSSSRRQQLMNPR